MHQSNSLIYNTLPLMVHFWTYDAKLKNMNWLEIIELRTSSNNDPELQNVFKQLVKELKLDPEYPKITVYHNYAVDCDYSIHLAHHRFQPEERGSALGLRIAAILKTFGLVSHNTWIEQRNMHRQAQH